MAHAAVSASHGASLSANKTKSAVAVVSWAAIVLLAVGFVCKYVLFYYRNYNPASFDVYWPRRAWLFLHINGGTLALLTGPWQFWTGLRRKSMALHRWTGRLFLLGVAAGIVGSVGLAITTANGWAFELALMGLATAWGVTSALAYYTIRRRLVDLHKEWMIRAYVVTFAFVTFRILSDYGPTSRLQPENDRDITISWACWVVPLAVTEMVFQIKRARATIAARSRTA